MLELSACQPAAMAACAMLMGCKVVPAEVGISMDRTLPQNHVFGVPSHGREPQEDAGALIHSQVSGLLTGQLSR